MNLARATYQRFSHYSIDNYFITKSNASFATQNIFRK